jgi:hypothetical protein
MSIPGDEFSLYANAERQLCDEAAPVLAAILRHIEIRTGVCITEARVTVERVQSPDGSVGVNCTIVGVHTAPVVGRSDASITNDVRETRAPEIPETGVGWDGTGLVRRRCAEG